MNERDYGPNRYFAYGSNMYEPQMTIRCPGAHLIGTAVLDGWRFAIGERGFANIVRDQKALVHGAVWGITENDLIELDRFEGVGLDLYDRQTVSVMCTSGSSLGRLVDAEIYVEPLTKLGPPRPGYLDRILAGAASLGLPEAYVAELARGGA